MTRTPLSSTLRGMKRRLASCHLTGHGKDLFKVAVLSHLTELLPIPGLLDLLNNYISELTAKERVWRHRDLSKQILQLTMSLWPNTARAICRHRLWIPE